MVLFAFQKSSTEKLVVTVEPVNLWAVAATAS